MISIVTWYSVIIDVFWFDGRIYWTLWYFTWLHFIIYYYTHALVHSHDFTAVALYRLPTGDISLPLSSQTVFRSQLPACHNSSQRFKLSSSLTDCDIVRVRVTRTLRQAVYRQTFRLAAKPLEIHNEILFSTKPLRSQSFFNLPLDYLQNNCLE
jgi:hypothetical protein